jgi:hypothetical protein
MIELLLRVLPLALGAAITPSLFAVQLLIVSNDPWRARALAAFLGSACAFGIAVTVLLLGFAQLPVSGGGTDSLDGVIRLIAAVLFGAATIYFFVPHPGIQSKVQASIERRVTRAKAIDFFGITFVLSIKDFSSFILIVAAMHDIAVASVDWPYKAVVILLVFSMALSTVIIPPLMRTTLGTPGKTLLTRIYTLTMEHQFFVMGLVFATLTIYLTLSGIRAL